MSKLFQLILLINQENNSTDDCREENQCRLITKEIRI